MRRRDSARNHRPCRLPEPQRRDCCSARHAGLVSFPETAAGTPPGRTRPRSPMEPRLRQRSRRSTGPFRAPRRGHPMASSCPQNLSTGSLHHPFWAQNLLYPRSSVPNEITRRQTKDAPRGVPGADREMQHCSGRYSAPGSSFCCHIRSLAARLGRLRPRSGSGSRIPRVRGRSWRL